MIKKFQIFFGFLTLAAIWFVVIGDGFLRESMLSSFSGFVYMIIASLFPLFLVVGGLGERKNWKIFVSILGWLGVIFEIFRILSIFFSGS